jgi:hypothetical protein
LPAQLETDFRDSVFPTASIVPATVAGLWQAAADSYAAGIVPPSTTVAAAGATLAATLTSVFASGGDPASKAAAMEAALLSWATAIGLGMLPAFTATPPPGVIGFAAEFAKPPNQWAATYAAAATLWAGLIDAWMKTGLATLNVPPNTVVPWT